MLKVRDKYEGALIVRYVGGCYGSGDSLLKKGSLYLVEKIQQYPCSTDFFLMGFPDNYSFNSVWFDEVGELDGTPATKFMRMYVVLPW